MMEQPPHEPNLTEATVAHLNYIPGLGPCGRRNAALLQARTPWVFLVDGDVKPAATCLPTLLEAALGRPDVAAVSPRILDARTGLVLHDAGGAHFLGDLCLENRQADGDSAGTCARSPGAASSAAWLVRRDWALACGLFDESLEVYRDDLDFSLRVRALGACLLHVPEALAFHDRSPRAHPADLRRSRVRLQGRNRWLVP